MVDHHEFVEELTCSICQELVVSAMTLGCSHSFCELCITTWLSQKMICPVCRVVPRTQAIRALHMDSLVEKLVNKLEGQDKQAYMTRKLEKEQFDKLKKGIAYARESGFKFLSINDHWTENERRIFSEGVGKYTGEARNLYCSVAGLTDFFITTSPREVLYIASKNLGASFHQWTPLPTLQQYLRTFLKNNQIVQI